VAAAVRDFEAATRSGRGGRKRKKIPSTAEWAAGVRAQEAAAAARIPPITVVSGGLPSLGKRR